MSSGGRKGPGKGPKSKDKDDTQDTKNGKTPAKDKASTKDKTPAKEKDPPKEREETVPNGDHKDEPGSPPKPQSAGASMREAANRLLVLSQKGDWSPVEQVLKSLEKAVANGGEDVNHVPLAGVADPVS